MARKWILRKFRTKQTEDRSHEWWQENIAKDNIGSRKKPPVKSLVEQIKHFRFNPVGRSGLAATTRNALDQIAQLADLEGESGAEFVLSAARNGFREFTQPKKSGGVRQLDEPLGDRRRLLDRLKPAIENHPDLQTFIPANAFGFRPGLGILDNLLYHLPPPKEWNPDLQVAVWNADLKDAFPNIPIRIDRQPIFDNPDAQAQYDVCLEQIFRELKLSDEAIELLLYVVTWKGKVPQGSPVSPVLMVMTSSGLMTDIGRVCQNFSKKFKQRFRCSIYADDLTISSVGREIPKALLNKVVRVARGYWPLNWGKIHHYRLGEVIHVTGLTFVDGQIQVRRDVKEGHRLRILNLIRDLQSGRATVDRADAIVNGMIAFHIGIYGNYQNIPRRLHLVFEEYCRVRFSAILTPH